MVKTNKKRSQTPQDSVIKAQVGLLLTQIKAIYKPHKIHL